MQSTYLSICHAAVNISRQKNSEIWYDIAAAALALHYGWDNDVQVESSELGVER